MKLSPEKRNHLILAGLLSVAAFAAIWFALISPRNAALALARKNIVAKREKLQEMNDSIQKAGDTAAILQGVTADLSLAEADMASNDPNAWIYDLIRHFKENYKVDISVSGQISIGDEDLFPNFPYQQLKVSVNGTAFYHDLGTFIADFENTYPHIRLVNLSVEPLNNNSGGEDAEKLAFHMDVIALVKPDEPQS